jgi:hypothetical protein
LGNQLHLPNAAAIGRTLWIAQKVAHQSVGTITAGKGPMAQPRKDVVIGPGEVIGHALTKGRRRDGIEIAGQQQGRDG